MGDFKISIGAILDPNISSQLQSQLKNIKGLELKIDKIDTSGVTKSIQKAIQDAFKSVPPVPAQTSGNNGGLSYASIQIERIKKALSANTFKTNIDVLEAKFKKFGLSSQEIENKLKAVNTALSQINANDPNDKLIASTKRYKIELEKLKNDLKIISVTKVTPEKRISLSNRMEAWLLKNSAAAKMFGAEINKLISECKTCDSIRFSKIKGEFQSLTNQARAAGKLGKSFKDTFKILSSTFSMWFSATAIIMRTYQTITTGIKTVIDLDTALIDLKKTSDATTTQLQKFYYNANETAKSLGISTKEVIDATSAWSRLGYTIKDAQTMSENSAIMKSVSPGMNIDKATDGLVSAMKAFKIDADDTLDGIISKINIVGNTQAVDNGDIVDILTRSSSAMAEANNTLEQTIALGTAATEITRDADSVGTALKTISMRIRGYDEETESYIGNVENLAGEIAIFTKTASSPGGISLFSDKDKTTYKSTYDLLKEISQIYDQLTDKQQAGLLETLAGKRQGQVVAAMLNNFSAAEKSLNSMANSEGNAMQEMETIYQSIEYHLNKLKETGTGIAQNLFQSDDMKTFIDLLTKLAEALDFVTNKAGLLGTIGLGAGLFAGIQNVGINTLVVY